MGSLFKSAKSPEPMNVGAVTQQANAQNLANAQTNAAFNRIGQTDQFGNTLNYQQTGTDAQGNPTFAQNQQLGATGQAFAGGLSGLGQQYFGRANDLLSNRPELGSDAAMNRAYDAATSFSAPRQARQMDQLDTRLKNQGFAADSEGYRNAVRDMTENQSAANNTLAAQLQGQMFNQGLADRSQQVGELQSLSAPGINFGNQTVNPNYAPVPQVSVQNVDVAWLNAQNYNQQMAQYQQQMAQRNAMLGGLASIGGTLAGAALGPAGFVR